MRALAKQLFERLERIWLKRWHAEPRLKLTRLDLKLDLSVPGSARAQADMSLRPQSANRVMVCGIGDVTITGATCKGEALAARVNPPYLILKWKRPLAAFIETSVQLRYSYTPDQYGTILQPIGREDCPAKVTATCRRPYLVVVQGQLGKGTETPPLRTYEWTPPRSRRLNAVVADVRSYRKPTADGMNLWLHLHSDAAHLASHILDLLLNLYGECCESNHRKLPYQDFHVVESDDPRTQAFNSPGLIVVPRGTFATDDKPTVLGILAPEFTKEWRRDPTRMVASGRKD